MVVVGDVTIDSTEVTNSQYAEFLEDKAGDTSGQVAECSFNSTYEPASGWPAVHPNRPVVYVDWCDAKAYCDWAGKRLCGAREGGSLAAADNPSIGQWVYACGGPSGQNFPYGGTYDPDACNSGENAPASLADVATFPCEGYAAGIYDMSGNATEWIDHCDAQNGTEDHCTYVGGSYVSAQASLYCTFDYPADRDTAAPALGFRCCL